MSAPSAPNIVARPRVSSEKLEFWWAPPTSGAPITAYTLACPALSISTSYDAAARYASVTGIPNQTDVTFTLTATNANGTGPAATFRTVQAGAPPYQYSVTSVIASTCGQSTALVTWSPSSITTQAATKWYVIRSMPANFPITPSTVQQANYYDTSRFMFNLSANTTYQFLIHAINDVGWARPGMYTSSILTSGGTFSPGLIPGLQIWLDASSPSNFTFSSGSNISVWSDNSGKGQNTSNVSGTPVYSTMNGTLAVYFPTNTTQMRCGTSTFNLVPVSTLSVFGMVNYTNGAASALANIYGMSIAYVRIGSASLSNTSNVLGSNTNANDFALSYFVNGTVSSTASPKYLTLNTAFQFNAINQTNNTTSGFFLSDPSFSRGMVGYYNEVLVYYGAIPTIQRQVVEGYLAWKWGRQADLPAGHPYKNIPPNQQSPLS